MYLFVQYITEYFVVIMDDDILEILMESSLIFTHAVLHRVTMNKRWNKVNFV